MTDETPLDRMQKIADFRTTCKFLRKSGKEAMVFGAIILALGAMMFQERLLDYLYIGLGIVELLIGLRNRYAPSASGVVLDGVLMLLFGAWNLTLQAIAIEQGAEPFWFSLAFGAIFVVAGIRRIKKFGRVREAFREPPTVEQIAWFDDLIAEIQSAKEAATPKMVEFTAGVRWKARLIGDTAIFVDKLDMENLIVDRRDIDITDRGKALVRNVRIVRLRIGLRTFAAAEISPAMLAVLESWRSDAEHSEEGPADEA